MFEIVEGSVEAAFQSGPESWTPMRSRDAGEVFSADAVLEFVEELRAAMRTGDNERELAVREDERVKVRRILGRPWPPSFPINAGDRSTWPLCQDCGLDGLAGYHTPRTNNPGVELECHSFNPVQLPQDAPWPDRSTAVVASCFECARVGGGHYPTCPRARATQSSRSSAAARRAFPTPRFGPTQTLQPDEREAMSPLDRMLDAGPPEVIDGRERAALAVEALPGPDEISLRNYPDEVRRGYLQAIEDAAEAVRLAD